MGKKKKSKRKNHTAGKHVQQPVQLSPSVIKGRNIALIACLPFFLLGLVLIYIGIKDLAEKRPCTAETKGKVISVTDIHRTPDGRHIRPVQHCAAYTYEVDGRKYTGEFRTAKSVYSLKEIKVYYDPADPEHTYVKWYEGVGERILVIFGIIWDAFILLTGWFIIDLAEKWESEKQKSSRK